MGRPSRYSPEVRERAVRMVFEHQGEYDSQWAAMASIASKIGCTAETLRKWVRERKMRLGWGRPAAVVPRGLLGPLRKRFPDRHIEPAVCTVDQRVRRCRANRGPAGPAHPSLFDSPVRLGKHPVHREPWRHRQAEEETPVRQRVRVNRAGATGCGKCRRRGNPLQNQRVPTAAWKPSASTLPTTPTAGLLTNH